MQSSRVLAMAWSPIHSGEFALSTKDGSLRIWHLKDLDNALLVGNYKKVPMFHLRYTVSSLILDYNLQSNLKYQKFYFLCPLSRGILSMLSQRRVLWRPC